MTLISNGSKIFCIIKDVPKSTTNLELLTMAASTGFASFGQLRITPIDSAPKDETVFSYNQFLNMCADMKERN